MKKQYILGLAMLLLIAVILPATALAETPSYVCPTCGEEFLIEAALVNHMNEKHGVNIQIEGEYHPPSLFYKHLLKQVYITLLRSIFTCQNLFLFSSFKN